MPKLLLIITCTIIVTNARICRKEKFEYYHYQSTQGCLKCDKCIKGEGRDPTKVVPSIPGKGAIECSPCEPCPAGYFNKKEARKCRLCKDCSQLNMDEIRPCTSESNTRCSPRSSRVLKKPSTVQNPDTTTQFRELKSTGQLPQVADEPLSREEGVSGVLLVFVTVVAAIAILFISGVIIYLWRKISGIINPEQGSVHNCKSRSSKNSEESRDSFLPPVREDGDNVTSTSSFLTDSQFRVDETIDIERTLLKKSITKDHLAQTFTESLSQEERNQTFVKKPVNTNDIDQTFNTKHVSRKNIEQTFVKKPHSTENLSRNPRRRKGSRTFVTSMLSSKQHLCIQNRPQFFRCFSFPPMKSSLSNAKLQENEYDNSYEDNEIFIDAKPISLPSRRDSLVTEHSSSRKRCNASSPSPTTQPDLAYWSRKLAANRQFREFALYGGISETDLSIIEADHANDVREQAYKVLIRWKQQNGRLATPEKFYSILTRIGHSVGIQKRSL